ncbi:substrate-binding periplasmic protein [Terasakiella pusilla]|uniref:substrate-binding periplasmic protein n=2 Tax=Terasakiella pusilla TaxID=64973 RepID=UPI003AA9A2C0
MLIVMCGVALPLQAKTLRVAVGSSIPPYVIESENRGIEFDILKEALASQGYHMYPVYVPLSRTLHLLEYAQVDGIMSTGRPDLAGCYTDSHITYWNVAITLKKRNLDVKDISDLAGRRLVSFQNAKDYLGAEFRELADQNPKYHEMADQRAQLKQLFTGRADVVVADRYIFEWYRKDPSVALQVNVEQEVTYHKIFSPGNFKAVFRDDVVCEAFNHGLKLLKEKGRYDEIIQSYGVNNPAF